MALKIEDYAMIGDCKTAALVGRNGSIDWLCWPRFDSAACFAALLGECENGRWLIAPKDEPIEVSRRYRSGTLVLETEFRTKTGSARLVDFMIPGEGADLVRIVVGQQGRVDFRAEFVVRFNYGATVPWVNRLDDGGISAIAGPERLVLRTAAALYGEDMKTVGEFTIEAGQSIPFVLSYGPSFQNPPPAIDAFDALERTEAFWRRWSDRCPEVGPWTKAVKRSLITLKALTYAPTGGIVAAPTTSLPELIAGVRNWDYRYCWLRDATFTLQALMYLGYYDEARAWRDWLIRAVAGSPEQVQIVYGVGGERWLPELTVPWLTGYETSAPVRIGNAAYHQLQLDVLGEVADALFQAGKVGIGLTDRGRALRPSYWNISQGFGENRMKAFGRCAADDSTSSIRGSWLGLRSIVPQRVSPPKDQGRQPNIGERSQTKSTPKCASAALTAISRVSCRPTARNGSTPACCWSRSSAFSPPPIHG
jgi:GH15 family glucan-1,4-alpha-glucosidase